MCVLDRAHGPRGLTIYMGLDIF
uniref:Uncharacterized protein n=1 Tax=Arundo donax TaxID=35708 RepID=A0A0A9BYY1_ARUDO